MVRSRLHDGTQVINMSGGDAMKLLTGSLCAVCVVLLFSIEVSAAVDSCESLSALKLPNTTITMAESVVAGGFSRPAADGAGGVDGQVFITLPGFCRLAATIKPTSDSDIKLEVWLPVSGWNGKYQAVGNGGWGGLLDYAAMARALRDGYATSSTDTGHAGTSASFALGHPEKLIDYAFRSVHEMTVKSKAIVIAFYGTGAKRSYFNGCSTGGRQALIEAQRFPNDFDGIVAGAAANPKTHLDAWRLWITQAMLKVQANFIPAEKHRIIYQAVLDACDPLDGVKDGLIENPTRCGFDPAVMACRGADGPNCLTGPQVEAARVVMSPVKNRRTGELIFPGIEPGSELGWTRMVSGQEPAGYILEQFKYIVFKDPKWDWRTFDLERDLAAAEKAGHDMLSAVNPNLTAFVQHGGKLLMYHGWSDSSIAPQASVNFYASALGATKAAASGSTWLRLYMVPGMEHCRGGEGPDTFNMMSALDLWVDKEQLPQRIEASKILAGKVTRTRPLCPYPQVARYKGTGSIDEAANFACAVP
jgi:feruloyl esterase